ncbi:MAG TPA: glycosyltransferase [Thermoanaerobaculia bacterium]|nr:glycosyltransferase [Thermoanaerobaculia bacterium]
MNLLFLTQTYPRTPEDGAGPFIRDLAVGLVRGGDRVTVLTPHAAGLAESWIADGVLARTFRYAPESREVLGYGRSLEADEKVKGGAALVAPFYAWGARRAVIHELKRESYDLVHAHWIVPNGLIAATVSRVPFAIGLHGSDVFLAEKPGVRTLARSALRRARLLTGCSPELVARVTALGFPEERSRVIPYGVDIRHFSPRTPADPDPGGWRAKLGIPAEAPLALGVGRMATKKGFHVLFDALPELFAAMPEAHVVLAGGGDLLPKFEQEAARFGGRVHLPGGVLRDTLPDLYRAADLFVLPAVHDAQGNVDGLPNVILEAMASGLAVVASGISGIPLAVEPGRTGLLTDEGAPASVAAALIELLRDPARCRAMGRAGRAKAERELTWEQVAARYREGYEMALRAAGC